VCTSTATRVATARQYACDSAIAAAEGRDSLEGRFLVAKGRRRRGGLGRQRDGLGASTCGLRVAITAGERREVKTFSGEARRVLMLSWEFPPRIIGGISRHVDELSAALARAGVEVDVLTAHHPGAPAEEEVMPGVRVLRAGPGPVEPLDFVCDIQQMNFGLLARLLSEGEARYDLVHAHDWLVAFAARTLKQGMGLPLVATIHATERGRCHGIHNALQSYIHSVEWLLTYDAWRVICCSHAMGEEVAGALRVPGDKVRVVPNGVDAARLRRRGSRGELAEFRRRWAGEDESIILFVGRLVEEKGVEVLIDAMPEVLATHPEAKLVVAGGGPREHLAARARERGVGHRTAFPGFVSDDLADLYAVADVAVFPSLYEPFGIVALEAMAAGVPVVTSDIGGLREVVRDGVTGLHTCANDAHSLASGIEEVLSNPGLATQLRRRARREVRDRFNWDGIAAQTISVYEEVWGLAEGGGEPVLPAEAAVLTEAGPGIRPRYSTVTHAAARS